MCHMENMDFLLTPTLRVCLTWKTWTFVNAYPAGMCHMENMDFFKAYPAGMCHMENVDLFNACPPGMCHMENMDFCDAYPPGSRYVTWKTRTLFNAYPHGMSHGKHGLVLTPTLKVCLPSGYVTWNKWTFLTPTLKVCHMENMDCFDAYPQGMSHGQQDFFWRLPSKYVTWKT